MLYNSWSFYCACFNCSILYLFREAYDTDRFLLGLIIAALVYTHYGFFEYIKKWYIFIGVYVDLCDLWEHVFALEA